MIKNHAIFIDLWLLFDKGSVGFMQPNWVSSSLYIYHDVVIKWKHFPCYMPFVRWIRKDQRHAALISYFICAWTNVKAKNSRRRWFETPSRSLWRHCNLVSHSAHTDKNIEGCWWTNRIKNPHHSGKTNYAPIKCQSSTLLSSVTDWFPSQRVIKAEDVSLLRHHGNLSSFDDSVIKRRQVSMMT